MRSTAPSGLDGDGIGNPGLRSPQAHCALGYLILHLRRLGVATVERAKVGKALKGRSRAGRLDASFRSCPIWVAPSGLDHF